ncbi:MAG TPA: pantoate--beta-alanine ligase, partial [Planococcus sp. (in: firmicutes)]|nr:pantoate--beta-alanine ligase [Planococcus sp. (in: firmicutes)]
EEDGLAKSSRNVYLSKAEREEAVHLRKALLIGKRAALNNEDAVKSMADYLQCSVSGKIDYIELLSYPDLTRNVQNQAILALAVQFEKARLIDNIIFPVEGKN